MKNTILLTSVLFSFLLVGCSQPEVVNNTVQPADSSATPREETSELLVQRDVQLGDQIYYPVENFESGVTLKPFGIEVSPESSPIPNERFSGFHTGADVEFFDPIADDPVFAVYAGTIEYANTASGYGGVMVIRHVINGESYMMLYGHLDPDSFVGEVGDEVTAGQKIAVLGDMYSDETDGERKHLHFSVRKADSVDLRGYVDTQAALESWVDPVGFFAGMNPKPLVPELDLGAPCEEDDDLAFCDPYLRIRYKTLEPVEVVDGEKHFCSERFDICFSLSEDFYVFADEDSDMPEYDYLLIADIDDPAYLMQGDAGASYPTISLADEEFDTLEKLKEKLASDDPWPFIPDDESVAQNVTIGGNTFYKVVMSGLGSSHSDHYYIENNGQLYEFKAGYEAEEQMVNILDSLEFTN